MADMAASILAKLRNKAKASGISYQQCLQRFELTGRMKDFYDIYYLARTFEFDGLRLQTAIFETLQHRGTTYNRDSFKRIMGLADDEDMQKRWKYFLKNINDDTLELSTVIKEIQIFLEPVFDAITNEVEWIKGWLPFQGWDSNTK